MMDARKYGYARKSTDDRSPALQLDALRRAGCTRIFEDEGSSGATDRCPALVRCLKHSAAWRRTHGLEARPRYAHAPVTAPL